VIGHFPDAEEAQDVVYPVGAEELGHLEKHEELFIETP
jgi:Mn-containing catalase